MHVCNMFLTNKEWNCLDIYNDISKYCYKLKFLLKFSLV